MKKNFNFINNLKNYKYTIFILLILIILFIIFNNTNIFFKTYESFYNSSYSNLKYYRCDTKKLGIINNKIFNQYGIIKNNNDWNIYIPCGYNNVERELLTIKINNPNQYFKNNIFIFGINGCDSIVSKNKIWETLVGCYGRNEASKYMPESYVLHDRLEMNNFKKNFNPKSIYILKKNVQRKEGLKITSDLNTILNSLQENYRVVQNYLTNLYLINKRKVNLRIYLLIVIKDGYKYFYESNLGKCIYTKKEYNHDDFDFESNITSYHLDMNVYKQNPRDFNQLYSFIDSKSNSKNNSNILKKNIQLLMKKVSSCISKNIFQSSNIKNTICFQIFGADVIFNNSLHPYLLEFNKGPDMIPRDETDNIMKTKVQEDMFKIVGILQNDNNNSFYEIFKEKL